MHSANAQSGDWRPFLKNYEEGHVLYQTEASVLSLIRHRKSHKLRVLKIVDAQNYVRSSNEAKFLLKLKGHPNILRLKSAAKGPCDLLLVSEFCEGGDLMTSLLEH